VIRLEGVQLQDQFAVPDQPLILISPVIAAAPQKALIPSAAGFHVGDGDKGLRAHPELS
jgi:hypothetical protein